MANTIDLDKAAKTAITMEEEGYAVYMSAAGKSSNALGKATLLAIAEKELMHKAEIEKFYAKFTGKALEGSKVKPDLLASEKIKEDIFKKLKADLNSAAVIEGDLAQTYNISMGLESKSYDFYKSIAKETGNADARDLFNFLAKEENIHYELLQDTFLYLSAPAEWFEKEEKWLVESALFIKLLQRARADVLAERHRGRAAADDVEKDKGDQDDAEHGRNHLPDPSDDKAQHERAECSGRDAAPEDFSRAGLTYRRENLLWRLVHGTLRPRK